MARYYCSGTPGSRVRIAVAQYPQNHFNDYKYLCGIFSNRNFRVKSSNNNTATRFQPSTQGLTCTAINKEAFRVFSGNLGLLGPYYRVNSLGYVIKG